MTCLVLRTRPESPTDQTYAALMSQACNAGSYGLIHLMRNLPLRLCATGTAGCLDGLQVLLVFELEFAWPTYCEDDVEQCVEVYGRITEVVNGDPRLHDAIDGRPFAAGTFIVRPAMQDVLVLFPENGTALSDFDRLIDESRRPVV